MTSTVRIKDILECLNNEAPFDLAETWDNVGLLVGDREQVVTSVLAGLDPTNALVDEAIELGANTIITHHPVIFKPLAIINTAEPDGRLLAKALANNIAIIGCHTNFDSARDGVSDELARNLGLTNLSAMVSSPQQSSLPATGIGRIGSYDSPISAEIFINRVLETLKLPCVQLAGKLPETVTTVAVCGGSGSDFAPLAKALGADVYLSAEIKHSTAIWAVENYFCIIDGTHYATEKPAVALLVRQLQNAADRKGWSIKVRQTEREHHPFVIMGKNYQQ